MTLLPTQYLLDTQYYIHPPSVNAMEHIQPSGLELQVLSVLWEKGPSSVRAVQESLPDGKERAYTTVLSTLQSLERKNLVWHTNQGNSHIYHPLVEKRQIIRPLLQTLVDNVFLGSSSEAMLYLLQETHVDEKELAEIRRLLDEHRSKSSHDKKEEKS